MTTTELLPASGTDAGTPEGELTLKDRLPFPQAAIAIGVFLLTVAVAPAWSTSSWAPKEAVLAALAAAGLPVLVVIALRRDERTGIRLASRFALAFVVVALISALTSRTPGIAMVGLYQWGTGWVFVAGTAGCFALGTRLGGRARGLLQTLLIFAGIANAVVAILQLTVGLSAVDLPLYGGSTADGLQGNPFELGAIAVAALALAENRFNRRPRDWYLPVAIVAVGAGASGERLPLLLVLLVIACSLWQSTGARAKRTGREARRSVAFGLLSIAGVIAGSLVASYSNASGSLQNAASSTSEETFGQRLMAWREGLRAFAHHFLLGAGPGQFRSVTSALFPLSFVKNAPTTVFDDAHNMIVEYLVTTGILGTAALLGWLGFTLGRARGPLVLAALVLLAIELAEPLNAAVTPVAFCLLGAGMLTGRSRAPHEVQASQQSDGPARLPATVRAVTGVFALAGIIAGTLFFVGDGLMQRSHNEFNLVQDQAGLANAATAEDFLRAWPDPASQISQIHFYLGLGDHPPQRDLAVTWEKLAVSRDPTNPFLWATLSSYQLTAGQYLGAQQSALQATIYLPWDPGALNSLGIASLFLGENAAAHKWFGLSLEVAPGQISIRNFYDGKCKLQRSQIGLSLLTKCEGSS